MISNIATLSWTSLRPGRQVRLEVLALAGLLFAALLTEPWWTLVTICGAYLLLMPLGVVRYARVRRQRAAAAAPAACAAGQVSD
jgi:CDP-diacylglycerol--serine O-phosphatidyltransferase